MTKDFDLIPEIKKRITIGWAAFGKVDNIMRSRKESMKIKRKIHDEYILPVMTYGCETWALNNAMMALWWRKMERIMLGINLRDRKRNTYICQETGVSDINNAIREAKCRWAGHIVRLSDNRWIIRATEWTPRDWTRKQGRPKTR